MRLQIVTLDNESNQSYEAFLHFGKIGEGHRCKGSFKAIHDSQVERTNSIAATIFIQKNVLILFHWHVTPKGAKIEDETVHSKNEDHEKMSPKDLFDFLILNSQGRTRRFCPA